LCNVVDTKIPEPSLEDILIVLNFSNVFPEEILGIPPPREVEFCIYFGARSNPYLQTPCRMAPTKLKELKVQLDALVKKVYITLCTSPWGAPVLFMKNKYETLRLCINYGELKKDNHQEPQSFALDR